MTTNRNQNNWRKRKASYLATADLWSLLFLWSHMYKFAYFCNLHSKPWWVNMKLLTCRSFHMTMCRPTMWSHMYFQRWSKFPFICMCMSSCRCKLLNFFLVQYIVIRRRMFNPWKRLVHFNLCCYMHNSSLID